MTPYAINGKMDEYIRECFKVNKNSAMSFFLIASYCYYCRYDSIMSDEVFDGIAKWLLKEYDKIQHVNKDLVTKEMLNSGTAYNLKESDYPLRVKVIGEQFIKLVNEGRGQE